MKKLNSSRVRMAAMGCLGFSVAMACVPGPEQASAQPDSASASTGAVASLGNTQQNDGLSEPTNVREEDPVRGPVHRVAVTQMNPIPGGDFSGITIASFWLDQTEVTAAQYADCVAAHVCPTPGKAGDWSATYGVRGRQNMPVNEVSWFNARTYCQWVGKRLSTEKEWEWAARGREEARQYPWGNELPTKESACWMRWDNVSPRGLGPCDVGQSNVSRDGVKDMAGNVWEWTLTPGIDGMTVVLKGGAWYNDDPTKLLNALHGRNSPYDRSAASDGIRCASSVPDAKRIRFPQAPGKSH